MWCVLGKHFRSEVDVLSLTCSEHQASQGPPSQDVSSVMSGPSADDVWWSSECQELRDVISVLSRQVSHDIFMPLLV